MQQRGVASGDVEFVEERAEGDGSTRIECGLGNT
jgi:hypothetical protein